MTTEEQARQVSEPRTAEPHASIAVPIMLLILAFICGGGALILVVFGMWPAVILVLLAGIMGAWASHRIRRSTE